jgi:hypothetical protein
MYTDVNNSSLHLIDTATCRNTLLTTSILRLSVIFVILYDKFKLLPWTSCVAELTTCRRMCHKLPVAKSVRGRPTFYIIRSYLTVFKYPRSWATYWTTRAQFTPPPHPTLPHPTLPYPTLLHPTLLHPTLPHPTLLHPTLPHTTLLHPTLPYRFICISILPSHDMLGLGNHLFPLGRRTNWMTSKGHNSISPRCLILSPHRHIWSNVPYRCGRHKE